MSETYNRLIESDLSALMREVPAIAVDGLKGVGKTVSCKAVAKTVFELDNEADALVVTNDVTRLGRLPPPVLIDEWQKVPKVWDYVRRAVDAGAAPGSFLLTGSIANTDTSLHSGAGRILRVRMFPLSLAERGLVAPTVSLANLFEGDVPFAGKIAGDTTFAFADYLREIVTSGLPAMRRYADAARPRMLASYLENLLSHEFRQQGLGMRQPKTLLGWLKSFAAAIGTNANYSEILDASTSGEGNKPSAKTSIAYREALGNLWLLDEVPVWSDGGDYISQLKTTPRHYLADPAFAAHLLGFGAKILSPVPIVKTRFDAKYGSILGRLFESLAQLSLRVYCSMNQADLSFLRTRDGAHEVDFILQCGWKTIAIEVKLAPSVSDDDVRHLNWLREKLGDQLQDALVLTTGRLAYRREDGIGVVPLALLGA